MLITMMNIDSKMLSFRTKDFVLLKGSSGYVHANALLDEKYNTAVKT